MFILEENAWEQHLQAESLEAIIALSLVPIHTKASIF